ncbi:hypothetical protein BDV98DRAFT_547013 [Pterulicium gracile]|uniref:Heme oxygenase-like protein n=1 Tax=Pterulicium gracile TaxID=1884261 RepID=A0A5C3QPR6_9AGAR|nr:hypothetical protein BDV98DRAFT_547013 [Pterula gracilis]
MIDWTQPLSALLKDGTTEAHERIENTAGAGYLTRAELDKVDYSRYLMILWHIYDAFERALVQHQSHPALAPTYNPVLLQRAPALAADISFLLQIPGPEDAWKSHPVHTQLLASPPEILTKYTNHINAISASADPSPLLAHSYVRYLGDLSGGQFIRRKTAKAYDLDEETGAGIAFYQFSKLGESGSMESATQGDMRKIKIWFRDGLDAGAGDNLELKQTIVAEANRAFDLSSEVFETLTVSSPPSQPTPESTQIAPPTPTQLTPKSGQVLFVHQPEVKGKTYPIASVIAVITALCLAHLALTLGGFTGQKGFAKLLQVEEWVFGSTSAGGSAAGNESAGF